MKKKSISEWWKQNESKSSFHDSMINNNDNRLKCRNKLENAIKANKWKEEKERKEKQNEKNTSIIINDEEQILSF